MKSLQAATITLVLSLIAAGIAPEAWAAAARKTPSPKEAVRLAAPPLFSAKYTVEADGFEVGKMRRSTTALSEDTYAIETKVETIGLVSVFKPDKYVERSVLKATPQGYVPLEFSSKYTGRFKEVVERLIFDWSELEVESLRNGNTKKVSIEPGMLDKLMYQVVLQSELSRGITRFRYQVVDRGKIDTYEMHVVDEETINTALGKQRTIKIQKGTTTIWCAVDLDYVPVKLEQREDGHVITTHIKSLSFKARASSLRAGS